VIRRCGEPFATNAGRLQLCALAYNFGNVMRALAVPETTEPWSLSRLREKLIRIGASVASHGRYVAVRMAEVAVTRKFFGEVPRRIDGLRPKPAPA
jgi:hypothetical protein